MVRCTAYIPCSQGLTLPTCSCRVQHLTFVPVFLRRMRYCRSSTVESSPTLAHITRSRPCTRYETNLRSRYGVLESKATSQTRRTVAEQMQVNMQ